MLPDVATRLCWKRRMHFETLSQQTTHRDSQILRPDQERMSMDAILGATSMSRAPSLDDIGLETGTDKASFAHGYLTFYERFFEGLREQPVKILEIGVLEGASVKMWEQYFPNGTVIGADIDTTVARFETPRIKIEIVDQSNIQELVDLAVKHGPFDIIVEDGSHFWEHQITSLRTLFPFVKDTGFYIVEDLQTNFGNMAEDYRGISTITCVDYLKRLVDLRVATDSTDIAEEEDAFLRTFGRSIGFVAFYKHACLIEKRLERNGKPPQLERRPLTAIDPTQIFPIQIMAHIGQLGDVNDSGAAWVSAEPSRSGHIQGFVLVCPAEIEDQIRYRARRPNRTWTDWAPGNSFIGSRGAGLALTGFSVECSGRMNDQYDLYAVGAFSLRDDIVTVGNGGDCVSKEGGARLRGMQIIVKPKTTSCR